MLHEVIPDLLASDATYEVISRFVPVLDTRGSPKISGLDPRQPLDQFPEQSHVPLPLGARTADRLNQDSEVEARPGHSLFQEMFFFCTVKKVADLPGSGCIYVETVVDRDSGISFAKVYSSKNAINAVDILSSRVLPFFKRQEVAIKEIHTRNTTGEYRGSRSQCTRSRAFWRSTHIRHLPMEYLGRPGNYLCEEFYRRLLKDFFPSALRRKFPLSLRELQKDLDAFVEAYNAAQIAHQLV